MNLPDTLHEEFLIVVAALGSFLMLAAVLFIAAGADQMKYRGIDET